MRARSPLAATAAGCCLALLAAGCGASSSAAPARGSASADTQLSHAQLRAVAARYLAIARPANHRLDVDFDGYGDHQRDDLAAARRDLRSEVAAERRFDRQLLSIRFPSWIALTAQGLVAANQRRIELTRQQADAASLASMRALDHRHAAANAAVEQEVRQIRLFLGLPPASTS